LRFVSAGVRRRPRGKQVEFLCGPAAVNGEPTSRSVRRAKRKPPDAYPGRRKKVLIREPEDLHEAHIERPDEEIGAVPFT
jgi:hypothetical protein